MHVRGSNRYGLLDEARLEAFERTIGSALPENYRAWLRIHNGGGFIPAHFRISPAEGDSTVHHVHGLHDGPGYTRLDSVRNCYQGRMPAALLPVADDVCGNALCLGLSGPARGRVYFWNHEREAATGGADFWGNVTEIAPSWPAFLAGLAELQSDDPAAAG